MYQDREIGFYLINTPLKMLSTVKPNRRQLFKIDIK